MVKKLIGLFLVMAIFSTAPAFANTKLSKALPAAPALAVEILKEHGVEPSGAILRSVALQVGTGSSFMGIEKDDPSYRHQVMHYLHCVLGVFDKEAHECTHHDSIE